MELRHEGLATAYRYHIFHETTILISNFNSDLYVKKRGGATREICDAETITDWCEGPAPKFDIEFVPHISWEYNVWKSESEGMRRPLEN